MHDEDLPYLIYHELWWEFTIFDWSWTWMLFLKTRMSCMYMSLFEDTILYLYSDLYIQLLNRTFWTHIFTWQPHNTKSSAFLSIYNLPSYLFRFLTLEFPPVSTVSNSNCVTGYKSSYLSDVARAATCRFSGCLGRWGWGWGCGEGERWEIRDASLLASMATKTCVLFIDWDTMSSSWS